MTVLPCITLWQPYAQLIYIREKRHETRSWRYPAKMEGMEIAIHAALKAVWPEAGSDLDRLCEEHFGAGYPLALHRGAVVATARLAGCFPTETRRPASRADRLAGDWTPGRFAWALADIRPLETPVPAKGRQGWWTIPRADLAL